MLQPPDLSPLVPQTHLLPNGRTLHYFPNHALGLVKLDITLEAGSRYQRCKCQAHAANRLFGEVTACRDAGEVAEFLDFRGIVVERMIDVCVANITFYFLRRYADELFPLIREMFDTYSNNQAIRQSGNQTFSTLNSQLFEACVASRRQQLAMGFQKTSYVARNHFYEMLYGSEHPLGTYAVPEDVDALTLDDVTAFIAQHYHLGDAHLLLSGSVDDALLSLADQYLAPSSITTVSEPILPQPSSQFSILNSQLSITNEPPLPRQRPLLRGVAVRPGYVHSQLSIPTAVQSSLRIGRILPMGWDTPDYARFMVLNTVLGGYFGSRLMSSLREDKGYTYGIYSLTQIHRGSIVFSIVADVAAEATSDAVAEVFDQIDRLRQQPVPEEELDRVRNYMMGDFIRSIDGVFEVSERYRQMVATHTVGTDDNPEILSSNLLDAIAHVTPAQLQTLAQTHLADLVTVTVGPQPIS